MQLSHYLRVLRRLWALAAALTVLGAVGGYLSTPAAETADGTHYYRATNSLILVDVPSGKPDGVLQQAAFRATTGEVPTRVAAVLGLEHDDVTSRVQAQSRADLLSLLLTGISTDPEEAALLANTTATELIQYLSEEATADQARRRDTIFARRDEVTERVRFLDTEVAAAPNETEAAVLRAERDAAVTELSQIAEQVEQLAAEGTPTSGFSSIESAAPIEISRKAFNQRRGEIAAGVQPIKTGSNADDEEPRTEAVEAPKGAPSPLPRAVLGGFVGLLAGLGLAFLLDRYDTRIRQREDAEEAFGLQVITEIPTFTHEQEGREDVLCFTEPRSQLAEAHRLIRTSVLYLGSLSQDAGGSPSGPVVLVTSPSPEDGKTTTVVNLAAVLAETGMSVLVVNCDFRRPRIHRFLRDSGAAVLHDADDLQFVQTGIPGVRMVTNVKVGPETNPADVIARQRDVVNAARGKFDIILLDTAPFLTTNDAAELLPEADLVLLVAQMGKTRWDAAARTSELLARLGARVIGVVLTNSPTATASDYYYYYLSDGGDGTKTRKRRRKHRERADEAAAAAAHQSAAGAR